MTSCRSSSYRVAQGSSGRMRTSSRGASGIMGLFFVCAPRRVRCSEDGLPGRTAFEPAPRARGLGATGRGVGVGAGIRRWGRRVCGDVGGPGVEGSSRASQRCGRALGPGRRRDARTRTTETTWVTEAPSTRTRRSISYLTCTRSRGSKNPPRRNTGRPPVGGGGSRRLGDATIRLWSPGVGT